MIAIHRHLRDHHRHSETQRMGLMCIIAFGFFLMRLKFHCHGPCLPIMFCFETPFREARLKSEAHSVLPPNPVHEKDAATLNSMPSTSSQCPAYAPITGSAGTCRHWPVHTTCCTSWLGRLIRPLHSLWAAFRVPVKRGALRISHIM